MGRKFTPSQTVHPEIAEIVDILADRVVSRGCVWINLIPYIRHRIILKALGRFKGSRSQTRRCLGMAERTLRWHLFDSNYGTINREVFRGR